MLVHGLLNHSVFDCAAPRRALELTARFLSVLYLSTLLVIVVLSSQFTQPWLETFRSSTARPVRIIVGEK
jgi:hypothetical protein